MTEREIREKAEKKVRDKKGFYAHLMSYAIVITFLFLLNLITSAHVWWFIYPALGWGLGLAFHYFAVFGFGKLGDDEWEQKELEREIRRLKRNNHVVEEEEDILDLNEPLELKEIEKEKRKWDDRDFV